MNYQTKKRTKQKTNEQNKKRMNERKEGRTKQKKEQTKQKRTNETKKNKRNKKTKNEVKKPARGCSQVVGHRWCTRSLRRPRTRNPPCEQLLARLGRALGEFVVVFFLSVFCDASPFAVSSLGCPVTLVPSFPSRTHASDPPCEQRLTAVGGRGTS